MESVHLHVLICQSLASGKFRLRVAKAENLRGSRCFSFFSFFKRQWQTFNRKEEHSTNEFYVLILRLLRDTFSGKHYRKTTAKIWKLSKS